MVNLSVCKKHYEGLKEWKDETGDGKNIKLVRSNINDCYYCKANRLNAVSLESVINLNNDLEDECSSGVCPVR